eukprot:COSAG01_NODE_1170_length_11406_cov_17.917662_6_plen_92_part_00
MFPRLNDIYNPDLVDHLRDHYSPKSHNHSWMHCPSLGSSVINRIVKRYNDCRQNGKYLDLLRSDGVRLHLASIYLASNNQGVDAVYLAAQT